MRVVELGKYVAGPLASRLLADLGADVVKVEGPEGDPFRRFTRTRSSAHPNFVALNHNKRSIAIDLKTAGGRDILSDLVAQADVFIVNSRPSWLAGLGIDYDRVRRRNARIIYCSISGFGDSGPFSSRPGYDMIGQALSGLASQIVDPENPRVMGPNFADYITAMTSSFAVVTALLVARETGEGQKLEISLVGSALSFLSMEVQRYIESGSSPGPFTRPASSLSFVFRSSDQKLFGIHLSSPEKFWLALVRVVGDSSLASDDRFSTHHLRQEHYDELRLLLQDVFSRDERDSWLARLGDADVPCGPILDVGEAYESELARSLGLQQAATTTSGDIRMVGVPIQFGVSKIDPPSRHPGLGEHGRAILHDMGYADADIEQAVNRGDVVVE